MCTTEECVRYISVQDKVSFVQGKEGFMHADCRLCTASADADGVECFCGFPSMGKMQSPHLDAVWPRIIHNRERLLSRCGFVKVIRISSLRGLGEISQRGGWTATKYI